ncbi:hypothetical protein ACFVW8_02015 [Streptomyces sp. NPDC058221]|uniref:hypothetical protein n=1 Tax=Streptomyces sp. NPDC058221 TaxID=3346388 RepID=UPI0036EE0323
MTGRWTGPDVVNVCYEQTSRFWTTLLQHGCRISDLTRRLARLQPRSVRSVRSVGPWDPKRYAAICPESVKAMVFYAAPRWRSLALSGTDEDFRAFHAEFVRRPPNESSLRTTAKPRFIHQIRMIAHTIESATAPEASVADRRSATHVGAVRNLGQEEGRHVRA